MTKALYVRLVILLLALFILFAGATYFVSQNVIIAGFNKVETDDYNAKIKVIRNSISKEEERLRNTNRDWSFWDTIYDYPTNPESTFIEDQILMDELENLGIDYFAILDNYFRIKYILTYQPDGSEVPNKADPALTAKIVEATRYFNNNAPRDTDIQNIAFSYNGHLAINATSRILKNDTSGPANGYVQMGRIYNDAMMKTLEKDTQLTLTVSSFDEFGVNYKNLVDRLIDQKQVLDFRDAKDASGFILLSDYTGNPTAVIDSHFDRDIYSTAIRSRNYYLAAIYAVSFIAVVIAFYITTRLLTSRQKQLEGEAKYQLLFNQNVMPLLLVKLDKTWKWREISEANKAAVNFYALDINQSYYKNPINLLYGMNERILGDFLNNISNIGIAVDQTELIVGHNKLTVEIIGRSFNIGEQRYLLLSIKDLSERVQYEKKLEDYADNLRKFQLAVENASDQIIITDSDGIVIYSNESMRLITGFEKEEVIGKKAGGKDLWGGLMPTEFYQGLWRTIKTEKKTFEAEMRNRRKDGVEYDAQVSISPILTDTGNVVFFVGIERDITKAKEIDRAKTEFVSLASHQLRTPLSAINWYTEMLLEEDSGKINETQREYLNEIYRGNKRMVDLVNSLLNVSRIDMGTFDINTEPLNIVDMAKDVVNEMTPQVKGKSLSINTHFAELPMVMLDPKLTRIILQNLISNAVKYTPSKGVVDVTIGKDDEKYIIITVKDSGYGIPKKQQDKIFTKLFRADNVQALDTEGTGLGLYIVKSIIDNAGGEITFVSEENKGSTFEVKLPFSGMKEKTGTKSLDV